MIAQPVLLTGIVTLLVCLLHTYMAINVGRMRGKHQIAAPAMTGHPELERAIRVHLNTLETLPVFFAALWIATSYFHIDSIPMLNWLAPVLGVLWFIGRVIYMQGYMQAPEKRSAGFTIVALTQLALILLGFVGLIETWMAATVT